jgi:hypothetical protein
VRWRRVAAVAVAAGSVFGLPLPAVADPAGGGTLGPDFVRADARDLGAGSFPGTGLPASRPSSESAYEWQRQVDSRLCVVFDGPVPPDLLPYVSDFAPAASGWVVVLPPAGVPPGTRLLPDTAPIPPGARAVGQAVFDLARRRLSDAPLYLVPSCAAPGAAGPADAPSPAEIWEQAPLPRRAVVASPPGSTSFPGITRLTTSLSSPAREPTTAAVSLRGFDVDVRAEPVAYAWDYGDGHTEVVDDPARAAVTYTRRGDYRVTLYVMWAARAHLVYSPWGLDLGTVDLGTVTIPETRAYHVAEIRSVLRSNPTR